MIFLAAVFLRDPSGERYRSFGNSRLYAYLDTQPQAVVSGRISRQKAGENSNSIYLKHAVLHCSRERRTYPLGNLRIFFSIEEVSPSEGAGLKSGMDLVVRGRLYPVKGRRNPGEFDSRTYYACQGIYFLMAGEEVLAKSPVQEPLLALGEEIRNRISDFFIRRAGAEGGIFCAMLLGEGAIDGETKAYYQMGGILHLLAISGLHITLVGMGLFSAGLKLGAGLKGSAAGAGALVALYGFFVGGSPSTLRAVAMFLLMLGARVLGRCYDTPTALALAAALLVLENPAYLWYSGFLLSFGAVLGLVWPRMIGKGKGEEAFQKRGDLKKRGNSKKRGRYKEKGEKLLQALGASLGIQAVTLPVSFVFFGEVSLLGIALNLLVLPTAGAVLLSGFAGAAAGIFSPVLGGLLLLPGRALLKSYLFLARTGSALPYAVWVGGEPKPWQIGGYYGLLLLAVLLWRRRGRLGRPAGVGILVLALALAGWKDRSFLRITALDVGQGDGILWELPGGGAFLVDGGSSSQSQVGRYRLLPAIKSRGIRCLEGIFLTHMDEDHISGVRELLKAQAGHTWSLRTKRLFLPRWQFSHPVYEELEALAREAGAQVRVLERGDVLRLGKVRVRVLHPKAWEDPEDLNGGSLVLELEYGNFRGLFTGDAGALQEKEMEPYLSPCVFLKAAHHGSKHSTSEGFLKVLRPKTAFLSSSENNRYGHPAPEVLSRLREAGCRAYLTKDSGALLLITDGRRMTVETYLP